MNCMARLLVRLRGIPDKELAHKLCVRPSTISRWLTRQSRVSTKHIQAIAATIGCPPGILISPHIDEKRLLSILMRSAQYYAKDAI